MLNIVIFGAPGSGKGTQSVLIAQKYGLVHLSTGDILRDEIAKGTTIGKFANTLISKGDLVPDDLIIKLLNQKIIEHKGFCNGFIFDGFPRTVTQAQALDEMLAQNGKKLSLMLDLQVKESMLIDRLIARGKTSGRSDDNLETIQKRLTIYHHVTAPVVDFYKSTKRFNAISNNTTVEDCFLQIEKLIDSFKLI
ncbi:MAG: adenylate kinase [Sphingobacteriia bacterium]|jgi:adenylate kinase|nr:adenylate kinase [Paludibacteraceae bacterium]NCA78636.1 adenylate kinase [Sphingobacteriia bacterium]